MPLTRPVFSPPQLRVEAWPDPIVDELGVDPRGHYAEQFWLPLLGPSSLWLLRSLVAALESAPDGFVADVTELSVKLGLGPATSKHGAFMRTLGRVCQFKLARPLDATAVAIRRRLPPLTRGQASRLPESAQRAHSEWLAAQLEARHASEQRERARSLALCFVQLGQDVETTERELHRWHIHPALASEVAAWAWQQRGAVPAGAGGWPDDPTAA